MTVTYVWTGAVTDSGARVRAETTTASSTLHLADNAGMSGAVSIGPVAASLSMVTFDLTGLDPLTRYWFQVEDTGGLDAGKLGTFRTHGPAMEPWSYAWGEASCAGSGTGVSPWVAGNVSNSPVFDSIRGFAEAHDTRDELIMFCHSGDLHYRNIATNNPALFREAYRDVLTFNDSLTQQNARQGRLALALPWDYVFDDHDMSGNDSDSTAASRPAAQLAYRERFPHYPLPAGSGENPIYHEKLIGRVQHVWWDVRSARSPNATADGPDKTMLGAAQMGWFEDLCEHSPAAAMVIHQGSQWRQAGDSHADSWPSFEHSRGLVLEMLGDHGWLSPRRVCLVQGDNHASAIADSNLPGGFPVFQFAPLDANPAVGSAARFDLGRTRGNRRGQWGIMRVDDPGGNIRISGQIMHMGQPAVDPYGQRHFGFTVGAHTVIPAGTPSHVVAL